MTRAHVFAADTTLYHPGEGARVFPAGETDPGDAWSESPGGKPADKSTTRQAMLDLIAAQDQIDALGKQMVAKDHDLAVMASERDAANGKLGALEQRAIAAEAAAADAEARTADYMRERDAARQEAAALRGQLAKLDGDGDGKPGGTKPAPAPADGEIPANWRELHWTQRVKLAKALGADDDINAEAADAFIEAAAK